MAAAKKRSTGKRSTVSAEQFCKTWKTVAKTGGSLDEVAGRLSMSKQSVVARRNNYKKKGLKFPALSRAPRTGGIDVKALQAILDK